MNAYDKIEMLKPAIEQLYSKEGRSKVYISKLLQINRKKLSEKITEWKLPEAEPRRHLTPSNQKFLNKNKWLIKSRLDNDIAICDIALELKVTRDYLSKTIIPADSVLIQAKEDYILRLKNNAESRKESLMTQSRNDYDIQNLPNEIWQPVLGYENYMVSNKGRVKSLAKSYGQYHLITPSVNSKSGYVYVSLYKGNKRKNINLARLVAQTFLPNHSTETNTVNHKDGNKQNNSVENLEWLTQSQNNKHAYKVLKRSSPKKRFEFSKIIYKNKYEFKTVAALARFMQKSETQVKRYMDDPEKYDIRLIR